MLKILIRATNWLGDAVMSLPAIRALRESCPEAQIAVLARPWVADLYRREPCIDGIITYPQPKGVRGVAVRLRLANQLRAEQFDLAILLPNAFDAALMARLAGIRRRIGYSRDGRGWLLTDNIPVPGKGELPPHETLYYLELLRRAGLISRLPEDSPVILSGIAQARTEGERLFAGLGLGLPVLGLSPGAQNSRAKQWAPERFAEAAEMLAGTLDACVAVFGSGAERHLGQHIAETLRRRGVPVLNLAGETNLNQFIALAAACRVFLSNDSGAMHVASALGVPTVAVYGPTEFLSTPPSGPTAIIVRESVECSPCMLRDCPTDHRCMTRITAKRVAEAAVELLK